MGQTPSCEAVEMWNGSPREEPVLTADISKEMMPALFIIEISCVGHLSPLFSDEIWVYSNMHLAFVWNPERTKDSRGTERINKEDLLWVFKARILRALKLELNLSSNLKPTCPIQPRICPFHFVLSEKTEMWSAEPLLPLARLIVYKSTLKYWFSIALEHDCEGTTEIRSSSWRCSSPVVCLFFFFGCPQRLPFAVLSCALESQRLSRAPSVPLQCCLAMHIFNY